MATIQIKRFQETGLTPADKGVDGQLAYGELAINTTDNRVWVGNSIEQVIEVTNQVIFARWDPDNEVENPQPPIVCEGQLWFNTNEIDAGGNRLYVSINRGGLQWIGADGEGAPSANVSELNDLIDVVLASEVAGDILVYNAGGYYENKLLSVESLPNVDADQANGTKSTHGQVLMYDDHKDKWTPQNAPYDGAVLTPHTHYAGSTGFGGNPISFRTRWTSDPELHQYGDTYFSIGQIGWFDSDTANSLEQYRLSDTSVTNGWTEKNVIYDPPDARDGYNRYFKVVKKFSGSKGNYTDNAAVQAIRNWSTEIYGFQVRGNASLELVKMEWIQPPVGTSDPVEITMENDANILIVFKSTALGLKGGMNLSGDNFVPYYIDNDNEQPTNGGFLTKNPYPRDTGATITVTPWAQDGFSLWTWNNLQDLNQELHVSQWRVTQGIDETEIEGNPAFDFLDGAVDQDVLVYNGGTSKWGPVNKPPLGNNALEEIGDVDVTSVADGNVLAWDSANTNWKPYSIPVIPDHYIEKQYNFTGPIEANSGVARYYLPATISEIRITPYLVAPSTDGRVGAYLKYDGISIAFAALQTGETVGEETVITGTYTKGKYLTVEITDAGTNAQTLSLLITLKRA
ncbi:MAG: hypothetical protein VW443_02435 [Pseudomonadales bacterium]